MNRTGKCIKMLLLLNERDGLSKTEIAKAIETNPRNVQEYRRELEAAGFKFHVTAGRYGGYYLLNSLDEWAKTTI